MQNNRIVHAIVILLAATTSGCVGSNTGSSTSIPSQNGNASQLQVVATVGMVADIVREIGGNAVDVDQICGPGVDPHLYKATRDDIADLSRADMIFYSGLLLEGKMTDILIKIAQSRPVVAVTELIDKSVLLEPAEMDGHYDPHVWMDVSAWRRSIDIVVASLSEQRPSEAESFKSRGEALRKELDALHRYGLKAIASIPEGSRVLVTSHDAFNYLGRAYGLEVQGVQGLSTESEAGLQRVRELVDMLVEKKVQAVFVESSVSRKSIDSLIEGCRSQGHHVIVGGELFSDAMGEANTYEGTYIGMLDHNLTTIAKALGGDVPANGLNGKLSVHE
ncbi:MAG: metal ABC transporter solute-binding protein, Zn/Mn family [Aureliella sp.]